MALILCWRAFSAFIKNSWEGHTLPSQTHPMQAEELRSSAGGEWCFCVFIKLRGVIPSPSRSPMQGKSKLRLQGEKRGVFVFLLNCEGSYPQLRAKSRTSCGCALAQRLRALALQTSPACGGEKKSYASIVVRYIKHWNIFVAFFV